MFLKGFHSCVHIPHLKTTSLQALDGRRAVGATYEKGPVYFWLVEVKFRVLLKHVKPHAFRAPRCCASSVVTGIFTIPTEPKKNTTHYPPPISFASSISSGKKILSKFPIDNPETHIYPLVNGISSFSRLGITRRSQISRELRG